MLDPSIAELKNIVMIKEEQIKENLKDISEMENKISVLEKENENLKNHVAESETVLKRDKKKTEKGKYKTSLVINEFRKV